MAGHVSTQLPQMPSRTSDSANRYRRIAHVNKPRMKLIGIKTPAATHDYLLSRFRAACEVDQMTSAEMLDYLLDLRDRHETQRDRLAGNPFANR